MTLLKKLTEQPYNPKNRYLALLNLTSLLAWQYFASNRLEMLKSHLARYLFFHTT